MSHDAVKWIAVHFCEVCGDYAEEKPDQWPIEGKVCKRYYIEVLVLRSCDTCGLLACMSCRDDGFCCDRRAAIEMEGLPERPKAGEMGLFETTLEEPPMA